MRSTTYRPDQEELAKLAKLLTLPRRQRSRTTERTPLWFWTQWLAGALLSIPLSAWIVGLISPGHPYTEMIFGWL